MVHLSEQTFIEHFFNRPFAFQLAGKVYLPNDKINNGSSSPASELHGTELARLFGWPFKTRERN